MIDSSNFMAYTNMGAAWRDQVEHEKAIKAFTKSVEIYPAQPDVYRDLAILWAEEGDQLKALGVVTKAIYYDREFGEAYGLRGNLWLQIGNLENAIADFSKALKYLPDEKKCMAYIGLGAAWGRKGDIGKSIDYSIKSQRSDQEAKYTNIIKGNINYAFLKKIKREQKIDLKFFAAIIKENSWIKELINKAIESVLAERLESNAIGNFFEETDGTELANVLAELYLSFILWEANKSKGALEAIKHVSEMFVFVKKPSNETRKALMEVVKQMPLRMKKDKDVQKYIKIIYSKLNSSKVQK